MILYEEPHFTFRFAELRIIPRFHLDGVEPGRMVQVFKIDPITGERLSLLTTAIVGEGPLLDEHQGAIDATDDSIGDCLVVCFEIAGETFAVQTENEPESRAMFFCESHDVFPSNGRKVDNRYDPNATDGLTPF